jgi:ferredoxin-NADP reductase
MKHTNEIRVRVDDVSQVADQIKRFRLVPLDRPRLPSFSGGAHITVNMDGDERRIRNQYSLMSSPARTDAYEISVLRVEPSRGGSEFMHTRVSPGDTLWIGRPNNQFPPHDLARRHLLIAGGIGITPFMAMISQLSRLGQDFELHYAMRSDAVGAYAKVLQEAHGDRVHIYRSDLGERIAPDNLLVDQPLGTHLYVCGPDRMTDDVMETARLAGWPDESLHWEKFLAPPTGDPFTVSLARSEIDVQVGEHDSILEAVEAAGVDPPFLCRGGVCGQCETRVVSCDGVLQHNDEYLTAEERQAGQQLMICMSRFKGRHLTLDL